MPLVSFVTASYNYQDYIKETIESVINQTYHNWELIIVDDGSKDNSVNVIQEYSKKDNRIKLYQHDNGVNKGLSETIQLGIEKANGEWLVFLESDDTIVPEYLEEKLNIIKKYHQIDFIFNDLDMFGENKIIKYYEKYFIKQKKILAKNTNPSNLLKVSQKTTLNLIPTFSVVMVKKNLIKRLDFNTPIKPLLDYYLWLQLIGKCNFYYLNKKLTKWRMHSKSYINTSNNLKNQIIFEFKRKQFLNSNISSILICLLIIPIVTKLIKRKIISISNKK